MTRRLWLAALGLLLASCVQHTQVAKAPPAPQSVWDRQIHNAIDAGDGDYQLRVLRQKLAADPDDVPIRLELAKAYLDRGYPDVALEISRLAAARFPESGEAQLALVSALRDVNHRAEAIDGLVVFLQAPPPTGPQWRATTWACLSPIWIKPIRLWPTGSPPPTPPRRTIIWQPSSWKRGTT